MDSSNAIVGILLAAGSGTRFGADKLSHPLANGLPMAQAAARRLRTACDQAIAVVRPESHDLSRLLAGEGFSIVASQDSLSGMGHSLAAGIRAAPQAMGWLIALADMPFIDPHTHQQVAAALRAGASIAAPALAGRRGHPVGFARHWYEQLSTLRGDSGAKALVAAASEDLILCEVNDPGIFRDLDTLADLRA